MLTCFAIHFVGDNQEYSIRKFSDESTARLVTCRFLLRIPKGLTHVSRFEEIFLTTFCVRQKEGIKSMKSLKAFNPYFIDSMHIS